MSNVTKRELNQHTAAVLQRVTAAHDVVITERGKPRWRVGLIHEHESTLSRLEREGRYTPPADAPAPWPERPGGPTYSTAQADALLAEMRGDH